MKTRLASFLLALALSALATAPAQARPDDGRMQLWLGGQSVTGPGLVGTVGFSADLGLAELGAHVMAPPAAFTSFFTTDASLTFVGHTRSFLPIDLMPVMGFGAAFLMRDVPKTPARNTTTDLNIYMYMPVGLRYALRAGGLSIGAEALYHFPGLYLMQGTADPAHWHYELTSKLGNFNVGAYYESGAVYNGPGVRVGFSFL